MQKTILLTRIKLPAKILSHMYLYPANICLAENYRSMSYWATVCYPHHFFESNCTYGNSMRVNAALPKICTTLYNKLVYRLPKWCKQYYSNEDARWIGSKEIVLEPRMFERNQKSCHLSISVHTPTWSSHRLLRLHSVDTILDLC